MPCGFQLRAIPQGMFKIWYKLINPVKTTQLELQPRVQGPTCQSVGIDTHSQTRQCLFPKTLYYYYRYNFSNPWLSNSLAPSGMWLWYWLCNFLTHSAIDCALQYPIDDKTSLVQVIALRRLVTSHYPNHCLQRFITPYDPTKPK